MPDGITKILSLSRWTWHEAGSDLSPLQCHLFTECLARNVTCRFCYTDRHDCFAIFSNSSAASAVIGGQNDVGGVPVDEVEVIENEGHCNPELVADLPPHWTRKGLASATVGTRLYVCGGRRQETNLVDDTCLFYDIFQRVWNSDLPAMSEAKTGASAVDVYGELFIIGGKNEFNSLATVESFNKESRSWRHVIDMPSPRSDHCSVRIKDLVYIIGGWDLAHNQMVSEFLVLNTTTRLWYQLPTPNIPRRNHACVVVDGGILVAGGKDFNGISLSSTTFYKISSREWLEKSSMSSPRSSFGLALLEGKITAMGGNDGHSILGSVEEFRMEQNTWSVSENLQLNVARWQFDTTNVLVNLIPGGCT